MHELDADVIVVGGGPAGSSAAAHLASAGHDVLIVDRCTFPRDKICGDFAGPVALREMADLGIDAEALGGNRVPSAGLFVDGEHLITFDFPAVDGLVPYGRVIPRIVLDDALLTAARSAGARLRDGAAATGLRVAGDAAEVNVRDRGLQRTLRCRVVIAADGSGSSIARILRGRTPPRDDMIVAVRAYFTGVNGPVDRCDVYFGGDSFPGYAWIFPTAPGVANVGVGMVSDTFPPQREHLADLLRRLMATDAGMRERLRDATIVGHFAGWPLCTFDERLAVAGDRVMLAGDAAALINPLNGEGIQYALVSGRWAAAVAADALSKDDCSYAALAAYESRLRAELHDDVTFARLVVRAIANRSLNALWLGVVRAIVARARRDASYARVTGGVVAGIVPAREATSPRIALTSVAALVESALRSLGAGVGNPRRWIDTAAAAASIAIDVAADAPAAGRWGRRLLSAVTDFVRG